MCHHYLLARLAELAELAEDDDVVEAPPTEDDVPLESLDPQPCG
ncbi:hypothetical protein [Amycolatopsis sp. WQ 127309]|nr:hypothetical protein [Amycolatopsis sp. WQ 127309]